MPQILVLAPMMLLVAWAALIDARTRRIPNWLTASLALAGLVQSLLPLALVSGWQAWGGLGAGFGLTFLLFAAGAMGGGDVKLMAGIGAWVGPVVVFEIFAGAAIIGMCIVVWRAVFAKRLRALLRDSTVLVLNAAATGDLRAPSEAGQDDPRAKQRLPYAVPVLAATILVLAGQVRRWL